MDQQTTLCELYEARSVCGCFRIGRYKYFRQGRVMVKCKSCLSEWDAETGVFQGEVPYHSFPIRLPGNKVWDEMPHDPSHTFGHLHGSRCVVPLRAET